MPGLLTELVRGVTARFSRFAVAEVELQAGEQDRQPTARDEQVTVLGERVLAVQKAVDVAEPSLHLGDEHGRRGGGVVPAEPVHRPIEAIQRA